MKMEKSVEDLKKNIQKKNTAEANAPTIPANYPQNGSGDQNKGPQDNSQLLSNDLIYTKGKRDRMSILGNPVVGDLGGQPRVIQPASGMQIETPTANGYKGLTIYTGFNSESTKNPENDSDENLGKRGLPELNKEFSFGHGDDKNEGWLNIGTVKQKKLKIEKSGQGGNSVSTDATSHLRPNELHAADLINKENKNKKLKLNISVIDETYAFNNYIDSLQVPDPNHEQSLGIPTKRGRDSGSVLGGADREKSGELVETPVMKNSLFKMANFKLDKMMNL